MLEPLMNVLLKQRIVLASSSPRRKDILNNAGLKFEIIPSTFEEDLDKSRFEHPWQYAMETARQKANDIATLTAHDERPPDLIIGADTVVAMDDKIFEKPKDIQDAFNILSGFSGRRHTVYTGVILLTRSKKSNNMNPHGFNIHQFYEATDVQMATMTPDIIKAYIETGEPMDKAGGYGIQAKGGTLVEKVSGDYFNVMGFPLHRFCMELTKLYEKEMVEVIS